MERLKFIGKRLVYLVVMLFGVATLVFILTKLVPGNPVTANLSQRALSDPEIVAAYEAKYGLDQPIIVQYFLYIKNLLHLDLGTSIRTNNPVLSELARCYPATIELALFAIIIAAIFGILFGIISAMKRNSIADQAVRAISVTGVSVPSFWFALLVLYFFYYKLGILPGPGRLSSGFAAPETVTGLYVIDSLIEGDLAKAGDALSHLILPGVVLAAFTMGLITRTTRSNLLDVYRLYPYRKGKRAFAEGTDLPPCPWKRDHSCIDGDRSGLRKSSGRHGSRRDHFQLAGCGSVRLSIGYVHRLSVDYRGSAAHRFKLYGH